MQIPISDRRVAKSYSSRDFPFCWGEDRLSARQWTIVLAATLVGFLLLIAPFPARDSFFGSAIHALLFTGVPLIALALVAGGRWRGLFHRIGVRDVALMVAFALLNIAVSMFVGYEVMRFHAVAGNPLNDELVTATAAARFAIFASAVVQLLGEELITVLPLLAIIAWLAGARHWPRRRAILVAYLLTALLFGAAHLPTYNWNVIQTLVVIGSARLILTLPYLITRNIWVSYGAHVLNDLALFTTPLILAGLST